MSNRFFSFDNVDVKFEHILFLKLFIDENFRSKVMPILDQRYFNPPQGQYPYDLIFKYFSKFYTNNQEDISPMQVIHAIQQGEKYLEHEDIKEIKAIFKQIFMLDDNGDAINNVNEEYLLDETEKFAQESALELALIDSVNIIQKKPEDKLLIRGLLDDALSVQLNKDVGLNYFENPLERFKFYQVREDKVPFGLDGLNKLTFNGFAKKTLNVFMAGTGIGKCCSKNSMISVRNRKTGEIKTITIGEFYGNLKMKFNICGNQFSNSEITCNIAKSHKVMDDGKAYCGEFKKFVDSVDINDYEVLTDTGWNDIVKIHKTVPYCLWKIKTKDFYLECADTHIVFDDFFNEVYVKDLKEGSVIQTKSGLQTVINIEKTDIIENMFDLELGVDSNRRYYTNGILSHNTLLMTSLAKDYILKGYKVLYVTLEICEKMIALRVDANVLNIPISDFGRYENGKPVVDVNDLVKKFEEIKNNNKIGKLKIKEYPTGTTNTLQIKALLKELKMKEDFKPDVLMIDYVNLMNSSRLSAKNNNTYNTVKAIAEELRGIAMEEELIIVTATQTNRDGITGNEVALDKVSESAGLPHTADFFCGIFQTEQQKEQGIYILKVLKNRYAGNTNKKIAFGVDYNFMRFYQLDNELESELVEDSEDCDTSLESDVFTPNRRRRR